MLFLNVSLVGSVNKILEARMIHCICWKAQKMRLR